MTRLERAKIEALGRHVRIPEWGYGAALLKNLRWRLENSPKAPLSPVEKFTLDLCCWRYRRKLGGLVDFDLPKEEPLRSDYFPVRETLQDLLL